MFGLNSQFGLIFEDQYYSGQQNSIGQSHDDKGISHMVKHVNTLD